MLMFGLNLPIWRKSYEAGELEARADRSRMLQEKKETENALVARVAQALYDFENSDRTLRLYRDVPVSKLRSCWARPRRRIKPAQSIFSA